jgi:putative acetyltransferase
MRRGEGRQFLEVHHASVRQIATRDYSAEVIDAWAPAVVTDEALERFLANPDGEIRLVAEEDDRLVGIGALVVADAELRACYVAPRVTRRGVGSALVSEIERVARENRLAHLQLSSSLTAEPFYAALGYQVDGRSEHVLRSGVRMAAVRMRKNLT